MEENEKSIMDENANKPQEGTYDEMTPSSERKPKVEFEIDKEVEVSFLTSFEKPRELPSTGKGVYYLFDCISEKEEKIFMTAAWSLLQGLKDCEPLAGKTVKIKKVMKDGKQNYEVEDLSDPEIPVEKIGATETTEGEDEAETDTEDKPEETEDAE